MNMYWSKFMTVDQCKHMLSTLTFPMTSDQKSTIVLLNRFDDHDMVKLTEDPDSHDLFLDVHPLEI